jgi:nucleoside-diphosphate-sugar epimerase
VPFCRADPSLGARVNVVGTCNIFEAVRESRGRVEGLSYASSVAVFGSAYRYPATPVGDDAPRWPETLYGVYKTANEDTARVYWEDWQVPSVGLRPYIVYGVGRDQGMTSDLSKALLAAAAGRPYRIKFSGPVALQFAEDVARVFIESATCGFRGAAACNLRNDVLDVRDFVALLASRSGAAITCETDRPLPYPADLDDGRLRSILPKVPHTRLETAIDATICAFRELLAAGRLDCTQLDG